MGASHRRLHEDGRVSSFDNERLDSIETGKLADIVILSKDVFAEPPQTADAVAVAATVFDGKVVFTETR
jgi:predicted amidohydrolase YtcJ